MIYALRAAITAAGGTPTQYTEIGLLHELITAWNGVPTQFTIEGLMREAIVASGGIPTQFAFLPLLRELITVRGGNPTSFMLGALLGDLVAVSAPGDNEQPPEDDGFGPELWPQPLFNGAGGLALSGLVISDGKLIFPGLGEESLSCDATGITVEAGVTYHYEMVVSVYYGDMQTVGLEIGNAFVPITASGTLSGDATPSAGGGIRIFDDRNFDVVEIDGLTIRAMVPPPLELLPLGYLGVTTVSEGSVAGQTLGEFSRTHPGSALALINDAGGRFALADTVLSLGPVPLDYETATSHSITVRETLAGASNSPHDTVLVLSVQDTPGM